MVFRKVLLTIVESARLLVEGREGLESWRKLRQLAE